MNIVLLLPDLKLKDGLASRTQNEPHKRANYNRPK